MKQLLLASAVCAAVAVPMTAAAQTPAPAAAPASPHTVTGNMAVVSDYRFRGISQTDTGPAIQGGIDYSHASGFYLGNWNSSISSEFFNEAAGVEMDFYGGFKFPIGDLTLDIGALYYYYPRGENADGDEYNTLEAYVGASYGPISGKIWYGISDKWFSIDDASGSIYYELNGSFPIAEGWGLVAHVGYQDVNDIDDADYFDYKLGVTYDWSGWVLGAALVGTNADDDDGEFYNLNGNELGDTTVVFSVTKTF
jgi:uncharacterized protein (TIGR02001 family)